MKTQTLNNNDFAIYGFTSRPKYLCLKTYENGFQEVVATFERWNKQLYTVTNKIVK
jgi:hypothetical protein